jgi:hypothetical protein
VTPTHHQNPALLGLVQCTSGGGALFPGRGQRDAVRLGRGAPGGSGVALEGRRRRATPEEEEEGQRGGGGRSRAHGLASLIFII